MTDQASRKPRYQQKVDDSKQKIKDLEQEWQSIQEAVNIVTEEMTKIQEEQSHISTDLKQKKNVFRSKQVTVLPCPPSQSHVIQPAILWHCW